MFLHHLFIRIAPVFSNILISQDTWFLTYCFFLLLITRIVPSTALDVSIKNMNNMKLVSSPVFTPAISFGVWVLVIMISPWFLSSIVVVYPEMFPTSFTVYVISFPDFFWGSLFHVIVMGLWLLIARICLFGLGIVLFSNRFCNGNSETRNSLYPWSQLW